MTEHRRTSAETEAQIYAEARRLFNLKGYVGMTLREIASGVGIEAQSLYNYTKSKQELVADLLYLGTAAIQRAVDDALASADPTPSGQLWAAMHAHTRHYCTSDEVVLVRDGLVHLDDGLREKIVGALKAYEETFKTILRAGIDSGDFVDVDLTPACFAVLGMGESVVNWFDPSRGLSADHIARSYADQAVRSLVKTT